LGLCGAATPERSCPCAPALNYAADPDLKTIGYSLDRMSLLRNQGSYNLNILRAFASSGPALQSLQDAEGALALLDNIDADPARRATAIASIGP
jgi:hypothetical protein